MFFFFLTGGQEECCLRYEIRDSEVHDVVDLSVLEMRDKR